MINVKNLLIIENIDGNQSNNDLPISASYLRYRPMTSSWI